MRNANVDTPACIAPPRRPQLLVRRRQRGLGEDGEAVRRDGKVHRESERGELLGAVVPHSLSQLQS